MLETVAVMKHWDSNEFVFLSYKNNMPSVCEILK